MIYSLNIGSQIWSPENLSINRFRNGDLIFEAKTKEQWDECARDSKPAWCYYNNDSKNGAIYGMLYNWHAVNDERQLAPKGWHIPSDEEWRELNSYLSPHAGIKMKSQNGWEKVGSIFHKKNGNGTNESGFNGLPGGGRYGSGASLSFFHIGYEGRWWSSTIAADHSHWKGLPCTFALSADIVDLNPLYFAKSVGLSVRCIKD